MNKPLKPISVCWHYTVKPLLRVTITQRLDGPFERDAIGSALSGYYYVSAEENNGSGIWSHIKGSTGQRGWTGFAEAEAAAARLIAAMNKEYIE